MPDTAGCVSGAVVTAEEACAGRSMPVPAVAITRDMAASANAAGTATTELPLGIAAGAGDGAYPKLMA